MKTWLILFLLFTQTAFAQQGNYESVFDGTDPLTEEEYDQSENYIHQGKAESLYKEQCVGEDGTIDSLCNNADSAFDHGSTEQKLEQMMPMVTMAYSAIAGTMPVKYTEKKNGGPVLSDGKNDYAKGKDGLYRDTNGKALDPNQRKEMGLKEKSKEGQDYCGMIPQFGVPAITMFEQNMDKTTQQNLDQAEPQARQRASFLALSKVHKDRAKSAKIQFGMWGATAGCYGALLVTKTLQPNAGAVVKTGAATLLAYFYNLKKKAHEERAKLLEEMANKYPGAGDCNPFTETSCFCNEETSQISDPTNYQNKCVPKGFAKNFKKDSFICVDAAGKPDPSCDCVASGTCADSKFKSMGMQVGLNPSMMRDPMAGIKPLTSGFGASKLDQITERNLAFAKKAMEKVKPKDLSNLVLNGKKQKLAKDFHKMGIPKAYAARMAAAAKGGSAPALATSGLGSSNMGVSGKGVKEAFKISTTAPKFKSGKTARKKRSNRSGSAFGRFGRKKRTGGAKGAEILTFAQRAAREAEITKDKSKPIFDIITYRYKASAWREFRDHINKQIEEDKAPKK